MLVTFMIFKSLENGSESNLTLNLIILGVIMFFFPNLIKDDFGEKTNILHRQVCIVINVFTFFFFLRNLFFHLLKDFLWKEVLLFSRKCYYLYFSLYLEYCNQIFFVQLNNFFTKIPLKFDFFNFFQFFPLQICSLALTIIALWSSLVVKGASLAGTYI